MTDTRIKGPGPVRQHRTGAENDHSMEANNQCPIYTNPVDRQRKHLRNRYGLSDPTARVIAGLIYGEVRR